MCTEYVPLPTPPDIAPRLAGLAGRQCTLAGAPMRVHEFMTQEGIRWPPAVLAQDPGPVILRSVAWVERDEAAPTITLHIDDSRGRLLLCLPVPEGRTAAYRRLYAALHRAADRVLTEVEAMEMPSR